MAGKTRITILTHKNDDFLLSSTPVDVVKYMARVWHKRGFEVRVIQGIGHKLYTDILFLNINLTVIPADYLEFIQSFPLVINRRVTDISKHLISDNLLKPDSNYRGSVIIKTKANFGGIPEFLKETEGKRVKPSIIHLSTTRILPSDDYPIYDSIEKVPPEAWTNDHLIVEKFIAERDEGGHYCLRKWHFLGNAGFCTIQVGENPIVKGLPSAKTLQPGDFPQLLEEPVPEKLIQLRTKLGFDYGRFDYVVVDGEAHIFDVNKTPTVGPVSFEQFTAKFTETLPSGIDYYLQMGSNR